MNKGYITKKIKNKEKEILQSTKEFLNGYGIEYNEIHETILKNAIRETMGFCHDLIRPEFNKLKKCLK